MMFAKAAGKIFDRKRNIAQRHLAVGDGRTFGRYKKNPQPQAAVCPSLRPVYLPELAAIFFTIATTSLRSLSFRLGE
jgi:hypothetical protein